MKMTGASFLLADIKRGEIMNRRPFDKRWWKISVVKSQALMKMKEWMKNANGIPSELNRCQNRNGYN